MEFSIKMIITIIIVVVVLLAILIFLNIVPSQGKPLNLQGKLLLCCNKFLANDCDETKTIICDDETGETIESLKEELDMEWENLKRFCNCPE